MDQGHQGLGREGGLSPGIAHGAIDTGADIVIGPGPQGAPLMAFLVYYGAPSKGDRRCGLRPVR